MKNIDGILRQCGFFDLGLSLVILAVAGTTTVATLNSNEQSMASVEQNEPAVSIISTKVEKGNM